MTRASTAVAVLIVGSALISLGACLATQPGSSGDYALSHVNGEPLPAAVNSLTLLDGQRIESQALSGQLQLYGNGQFRRTIVTRVIRKGVPDADTHTSTDRGTFQRADSTLSITFTDEFGHHTWSYRIRADASLVGLEVVAFLATVSYGWTLKGDPPP
jgi:hypothetical protein